MKCHKNRAEPGKARCEECNVKKAEENRKRFASMSMVKEYPEIKKEGSVGNG